MTDALPPLTRAERELLAVLMNASANEAPVHVTSLQLRRLLNELDRKDWPKRGPRHRQRSQRWGFWRCSTGGSSRKLGE